LWLSVVLCRPVRRGITAPQQKIVGSAGEAQSGVHLHAGVGHRERTAIGVGHAGDDVSADGAARR
jgi:hypothetical protein